MRIGYLLAKEVHNENIYRYIYNMLFFKLLVYTFSWKRNRYIAREFVAIPYVPLYGH